MSIRGLLGPGINQFCLKIDQFCLKISKFCLRKSTAKLSKAKAQCKVQWSKAMERISAKHERSDADIVEDMQPL